MTTKKRVVLWYGLSLSSLCRYMYIGFH